VLKLGEALAEAERAVCEQRPGARGELAALLEELRAEQARLRDERTESILGGSSASGTDDGRGKAEHGHSVTQFHALIQNGKTCKNLYDAAFQMLLMSESMDDYNRAAGAVQAKVLQPNQCAQAISDMAALYEEAAATRMPARAVMERLATKTKAKLQKMGALKRTSRVCEKVVLTPPDGNGGAERVCDIVRDMFKAETMSDVAKVMHLMIRCDEIELLRFKDRFDQPSGGWRDAMINYRLKGSKHVCELQISHDKMAIQREQMGGHKAYGYERNARETLEYIGLEIP